MGSWRNSELERTLIGNPKLDDAFEHEQGLVFLLSLRLLLRRHLLDPRNVNDPALGPSRPAPYDVKEIYGPSLVQFVTP